jgi:alpha/beta superfamily hydrolase
MGGSYDDRVVGIVVEAFLGLGYVVGTFNFRYVRDSMRRNEGEEAYLKSVTNE